MASTPVFRASSGTSATANATSVSITVPAAVQVGDFMVLVAALKLFIGTAELTAPAGWTELAAPQNGPSGNTFQGSVYYKVAEAGDLGATVTVGTSPSTSQQINAAFAAYDLAGATPRSFSWNTSSTTAATTITHTAPATQPQTGDLVLVVAAIRSSTNGGQPTFSGSGGPTVRAQSVNTSGSAQNVGAYIGDHNDSDATRNVTATVASWWVSGQIVLVPDTVALDRDVSESLTAADAAGATVVLGRPAGETLTVADASTRNVVALAAAAEALGLADAVTRGATAYARAAAESIGVAEAASRTSARGLPIAETLTVSDALTYVVGLAVGVSGALSFDDDYTSVVAGARGAGETFTVDDVQEAGRVVLVGVDEGVGLVDELARSSTDYGRGIAETAGLGNALSRVVARDRGLVESVTFGQVWLASRLLVPVTATSEVAFSDAVSARTGRARSAGGNTVALSNTASRLINRARTSLEAAALGQAAVIVRGQRVGTNADMTLEDVFAALVLRSVTASTSVLIINAAGIGEPGEPLIIVHYHRADMTERPQGRTRMTAPPRGTARRTL